ncbi:D-aminoacyl-tRNA deacylase-like isoform X1 [Homalodisca vitripennis]|uniref:D-aminoacyl-tRNA deacylase-like isoform X1 n=1 Tax=Homalodisca vitripennis TaxID=197043 RepID=UPI001EEC9BE3|nr:D-aminoacyl-tRNA deacylase-like isoform X1 [Homalodisca vitripennis]
MRAVIQRVTNASILMNQKLVTAIGPGLCILLGISRDDTIRDVEYMAQKIVHLRLYEGKPTRSIMDLDYEILCQSQISLYNKLKGNKVSFRNAMDPKYSNDLFKQMLQRLREIYKPSKIKEGKFGGHKEMTLVNNGPFTVILESPKTSEQGSSDLLKNKFEK